MKLSFKSSKKESGQAVLMILLVLSVVLTLVVSSVTRSVVDLDVTKYDDNSIRAFDAAQAGIEKVLISAGGSFSGTLDSGAEVTANVVTGTSLGTEGMAYLYPLELYSGESATIWFVDHKKDTNGDYIIDCQTGGCATPNFMRFCWGRKGTPPDNSQTPAIQIETFYVDPGPVNKFNDLSNLSGINSYRLTVDPNEVRTVTNHFFKPSDINANGNPCVDHPNVDFEFTAGRFSRNQLGYDVFGGSTLGNGSLVMARVTMLYNTEEPHPIGMVFTGNALPSQGRMIESTGKSADATRKLSLFQGFPEFPFEFGSVVYSRGGVTKP